MDSGASVDLCGKSNVCSSSSCLVSSEKLDQSIGTMEVNKDALKLPEATHCLAVPITPDAVRENGDFPTDFQSPLTVVRKQLKLTCIDSTRNGKDSNIDFVDKGSPQTPKDAVFDPFAPGPDNTVRAPQSKKYLDELRNSVARRLNFEHDNGGDDAESLSDQEMFESVYENLLEAIVSKQTEGLLLAEMSNVEYDSDDCKTPPSALRLSGISDTCPGAPVKPGGKHRNIQVGLCKKLEF